MQHPPVDSPPCLTITLFGGLAVHCADRRADELPPQQTASLLAYLALREGCATPRQELVALLWSDSEPEKASQNLRQCLRTLRVLLEQPPFAAGSVLMANRTEVRLNPDVIRTDVNAFECAIEAAKQTKERAGRIAHLTCAAELYRGELLPGFYLDLFVAERHRLAEVYLQALHLLIQDLEAGGDLDRALHFARRIALLDPISEPASCALMRLYAAMGRTSSVLRQYEEWETRHIKEFGEPPGPASQQVAQQWQQVAQQQVALHHSPTRSPLSELSGDTRPTWEAEADTAASVTTNPYPQAIASPLDPCLPASPALPQMHKLGRRAWPTGVLLLALLVFVAFLVNGKWRLAHAEARARNRPDVRRDELRIVKSASLNPAPSPLHMERALHERALHAIAPSARAAITNRAITRARVAHSPGAEGRPRAKAVPSLVWAKTRPSAGARPGGTQLWVALFKPQAGDKEQGGSEPTAMTVDNAGNAYICGFVQTIEHDTDYVTIKYDPNGRQLWQRRWNNEKANDCDRARSIAVDEEGNVYVTGDSYNGDLEKGGTDYDIVTIKYDANGTQKWVRQYDCPATDNRNDRPVKVLVDRHGGVYVGVRNTLTVGGLEGYSVIKYDPQGKLTSLYYPNAHDATTGRFDALATDMAMDRAGHLYITGYATTRDEYGKTRLAYLTAGYDADGNQKWMRVYSGEGHRILRATRIETDSSGCIYVTGSSVEAKQSSGEPQEYWVTLKYSPDGTQLWDRPYVATAGQTLPCVLAVDGACNVTVVGRISDPDYNNTAFGIVSYDKAGKKRWETAYNGPRRRGADPYAAAVDTNGNVIVIGDADNGTLNEGGSLTDYATLKLGLNGKREWARVYDQTRDIESVRAVALDRGGNIIVTGQSGDPNHRKIVTIKYSP